MSEPVRLVLTLLPFLLVALLAAAMWGPIRRMRQRDRAAPPSPRTMATRMAPFLAVLVGGAIWGVVAQKYELVLWGLIGVACFGYSMVGYARQQRRRE